MKKNKYELTEFDKSKGYKQMTFGIEDTAKYTYHLNEDTNVLIIYENGLILSTVQGVTPDTAEEIFKEDVFNIAGVEL